MDEPTKLIIQENCKLKLKEIMEECHSKEYIEGYIRAYLDGFSDGNTYGMKVIEEIIKKSFS